MNPNAKIIKSTPRPGAGPHGETLVELRLQQGVHSKVTVTVDMPEDGIIYHKNEMVIYDASSKSVRRPVKPDDEQTA